MAEKNESGIIPRFYTKAVQNQKASEEAGRPIFTDLEYVEIRIAGDKNTVVNRKVSEDDRKRWPDLYDRYKRGKEQVVEGTPLKEWPPLTPAQVLEFNYMNIMTVEQLAQLPDSLMNNLGMGARKIREKAKAWLDNAKDGAGLAKLSAENEDLRVQIEALREQINAMSRNMSSANVRLVETTPAEPDDDMPDDEGGSYISALDREA